MAKYFYFFQITRQFESTIFSDSLGRDKPVVVSLKLLRNGVVVSSTSMQVSNQQWGQIFTLYPPPYGDYGVEGVKYQTRLEINGYLYDPEVPGNVYFVVYEPGDNIRGCESIDYRRCWAKIDSGSKMQHAGDPAVLITFLTNETGIS